MDPTDASPTRPFPAFGRWLLRAQADFPEKVSWKRLAELSGLSYSYLIQLKNGHERPTANAIRRLEAVLRRSYPGDSLMVNNAPDSDLVFLPILHAVPESPWLVPTGALEPVRPSESPGPDGFFVFQNDSGLMPSIPAGALCLTDPRQRHAPCEPTPMLLRWMGQAPVGRLVWRSPRGLHVVAGQGVRRGRPDRETPVGDGRPFEVLGQLTAVRYSLLAADLQRSTFV